MSGNEPEGALRSILDTLREYVDDLVLMGGWVPHLHLTYGRASDPEARTSRTLEADVLIPGTHRRGGRPPIARILEEAGFQRSGDRGVVWMREPELGETIEFFQPLRGPADSRGESLPIDEQPGLRALSLDHLWVLERFTERVAIPSSAGGEAPTRVRVPLLGAFALNKSNTFNLRAGPDRETTAAKDLLYLRDIMAAGERSQTVLEADLDAMLGGGGGDRVERLLRRGEYHLSHVAGRFHSAAAEILAEREGIGRAVAQADVEGHLTDLGDLLRKLVPEGGPSG